MNRFDERSGFGNLLRQPLLVHIEQLRRGGETLAIEIVAPKDNVAGAHLLGDAVKRSARRAEFEGNTDLVVGTKAVVAAKDIHRRRGQTLAEYFGEGFSDPLNAWRVGGVFEGKDDDGLRSPGRALGKAASRYQHQEDNSQRTATHKQAIHYR